MSGVENKKDEFLGKAKEGLGEATGNEDLANEGKADQVKSGAKQKAEQVGDAIKDKSDEVLGGLKDNADN